MRRVFKGLLIGLLILPALLVGLFILYELVGMAVNHAASARQTEELVRLLETELSQVEILDRYTETGNTSGTGNHVDMLSAVTFRTEAGIEKIEELLDQRYSPDEWSVEELEDGYRLCLNTSAPFADNIEGH